MQDEIELLDLHSPINDSSKSSKKKDNRIRSPPHTAHVNGQAGGDNDVSTLFIAKGQMSTKFDPTSSIASTSKPHENIVIVQNSDTLSESQDTSQLSDDVFQSDRKISTDTTSKTDLKSYKDKIKNRFHTIKVNAGKSTQKLSFKDTTKRLIMERIREENHCIDAAFQSKRKHSVGRIVNRQKMYDFFVGENNLNEEKKVIETESRSEDAEIRHINESTEHLINTNEIDSKCLIEFKYPQYLRFQEKESELEWYFRPSGNPVALSSKISHEDPRYLEEEGFFVHPKPYIPNRRLNIIEERLLSIDDKKWFNCDGEMNILENPSRNISVRPNEHLNLTENVTVYTKPILEATECQEVLVIRENILHFCLKTIKFDHHPLFSLEHVLERQLLETCTKYEKYIENNVLKKISNRLEASRHILMNVEKTSGENRRDKLTEYKKEIKELREALFVQGKEERKLLKLSLSLWKNIKKLRAINGYSITSTKLIINKESVDVENEEKMYEENLQKAYQEILSEYRYEFKNKMRGYKKLLVEIQKSPRSESDATTIESPKKPTYNVDEDLVFQQLKTRFDECFKSPGEPFLRLVLTKDNQITTNIETSQEVLRRNLVSSTKLHVKIICNKLTVCRTKTVSLNNNFECYFNEKISILLSNIPKFITVLLVEQSGTLQKRLLAEVNLNVPTLSTTSLNSKTCEETFKNLEIVQFKHEGIGSGIYFRKELEKSALPVKVDDDFELNTSGVVFYTAFWENSGHDHSEKDVETDSVLEAIIDKYGVIQVDKLAEWINQNKPDPQNPKNSVLYEYINGFDDNLSVLTKKNYFRLNPYQNSLQFCDITEIDNNIRMKVLQLRNQNEPEFDGMLVPNRVKEIPLNILKDYKRRIAHERDGLFVEYAEEDDLISRRKIGIKNLKQIHTKVFQTCKSSANNLEYEDMVDEKYLIHFERFIRTMSTNFFNYFRWTPQISHPLPELKKSNIEKVQTNYPEISRLVKITVKVLNGINIPSRASSLEKIQNMSDQTSINGIVRTYVEVRYNDIFDRTTAVEGNQPVWNEDLSLVLSPTHFDYLNPNSLSGNVQISVFDEVDQMKDARTKNWLGSFEAPLSAICSNNGMEGNFKINPPNIIFGYVKEDSTHNQNTTTQTYLKLQFSVQPNVPKLTPSIEELPCSDLPYMRDYILNWNESYNHTFPSRKFSALAINSNSKTTCLVRYIKPLEPPQLNNEGFDVDPEQCSKFVSLIPFTECNHFFQNIWLSTDQFLQLSTGSIIDHAVALTCFLLALKLDVWLLLGFGIPHGSTAYVLLKEQSKETELPLFFIYDIVLGEKISILDPYCPLQRIYCLIREQNIWANIQRSDNITITRFDLTRRSDWLPLFTNEFPAPTNSVQHQTVFVPKKEVEELEIQLERKIKKVLSKARPLNRTMWNKRIANIIKSNIHLLDYVYMHGRSNQEISNEFSRSVSDYDVCGYVLNLPFSNITTIIKKNKNLWCLLSRKRGC